VTSLALYCRRLAGRPMVLRISAGRLSRDPAGLIYFSHRFSVRSAIAVRRCAPVRAESDPAPSISGMASTISFCRAIAPVSPTARAASARPYWSYQKKNPPLAYASRDRRTCGSSRAGVMLERDFERRLHRVRRRMAAVRSANSQSGILPRHSGPPRRAQKSVRESPLALRQEASASDPGGSSLRNLGPGLLRFVQRQQHRGGS